MPDDQTPEQSQLDPQAAVPGDDEREAIARESGASEEQVTQLARVTKTKAELADAAGAAARWS